MISCTGGHDCAVIDFFKINIKFEMPVIAVLCFAKL